MENTSGEPHATKDVLHPKHAVVVPRLIANQVNCGHGCECLHGPWRLRLSVRIESENTGTA